MEVVHCVHCSVYSWYYELYTKQQSANSEEDPVRKINGLRKNGSATDSTYGRCSITALHVLLQQLLETLIREQAPFGNSFVKTLDDLEKSAAISKLFTGEVLEKNMHQVQIYFY